MPVLFIHSRSLKLAFSCNLRISVCLRTKFSTYHSSEDELLGLDTLKSEKGCGSDHSVRTAPVFTNDVLDIVGDKVLPQRALFGSILSQEASPLSAGSRSSNKKLYINTNSPFSGIVCGVQGSGKSHSTAVLMESCLIRDSRIGHLPSPLLSLVFRYDTAAGASTVQPCEAAYLSSLDSNRGRSGIAPPVTVLTMPNSVDQMRQVYSGLPNVIVAPLHFADDDINGDRFLAMMKVDADSSMPLYMEVILDILRSTQTFAYHTFRKRLDKESKSFSTNQQAMLNLRLRLLDSCLKNGNASNQISSHFKPGRLVIVDLSSPFVDASSACSLFDIILGLFVGHQHSSGGASSPKLLVLDEAHKYLSDGGVPSRFTESLLAVVRQQRHVNTRLLISTQEPTVVPSKFLDLCSFIVAHRFTSPRWLKHLANHVSTTDAVRSSWESKVVSLQTGEALFFAPAGLVGIKKKGSRGPTTVTPLGQDHLIVRSRLRVTQDGGQSLMAIQHSTKHTTPSGTASIVLPSLSKVPLSTKTKVPNRQVAKTDAGGRKVSPQPLTMARCAGAKRSSGSVEPPTAVLPRSYDQRLTGLVGFLRERLLAGERQVTWSSIGTHRSQNVSSYPSTPSKLKSLITLATEAGVVDCGTIGTKEKWVKLTSRFASGNQKQGPRK